MEQAAMIVFNKRFGGWTRQCYIHGIYCLLTIAAAAALAPAVAPRLFDLDVNIPAGPPTDWARGTPVLTPVYPPVRTPTRAAKPASAPSGETRVEPRATTQVTDLRSLRSVNLEEIVTVDVTSHIPWTDPGKSGYTPGSPGGAARAIPIAEWENLYWVGLVPVLRVLLHPEQVPRAEAAAHMIELGDAALPAARAGLSEATVKDICNEVLNIVDASRIPPSVYPEGSTPEEKMLFRFTGEELLRTSPYNPAGNFCRKLEMLGPEMGPFVDYYTSFSCIPLRRNAVSALALFNGRMTGERLLQIVLSGGDAVTRMRALSLLANAPLSQDRVLQFCAYLENEKSPPFVARGVQTLGELRDPAATPLIIKLTKKYLQDEDLLPCCVAALARIGSPGPAGEGSALAERILNMARTSPNRWSVRPKWIEQGGDAPDPHNGRSQIIGQLAAVAVARLAGASPELQKELFDWASPRSDMNNSAAPNAPLTGRWGARSSRLGEVAPYVQYEYLEWLARSSGDSAAVLESIANDSIDSPLMRAYALRLLPGSKRDALARKLLISGAAVPIEMRVAALQALDADDVTDIGQLADDFLYNMDFGRSSTRPPYNPSAVLLVLKILDSRNALPRGALFHFVQSLMPPKAVLPIVKEGIENSIIKLADLAASGAEEHVWRDAAVEFINDLRDKHGSIFERALGVEWRKAALQFLTSSLNSIISKKRDSNYKKTAKEAMVRYFSIALDVRQPTMDAMLGSAQASFVDTMILYLPKTKDSRSAPLLAELLAAGDFAHAPAACIALGRMRQKTSAKAVLPYLYHEDGFTRYCAYRALKQITGREYFADWIYGKSLDWAQAGAKYKECAEN
ncbi:MAG: hypothetical protein HY286_14195 [Planctomycetes bacterium]|nr:hypothetical protein [Planctomycetota bacterium]